MRPLPPSCLLLHHLYALCSRTCSLVRISKARQTPCGLVGVRPSSRAGRQIRNSIRYLISALHDLNRDSSCSKRVDDPKSLGPDLLDRAYQKARLVTDHVLGPVSTQSAPPSRAKNCPAQLGGDVAHLAAVDPSRLRRVAPNVTRYGGQHALIRRWRRGKYIASHTDHVSDGRCDA
ncbi:hypothetical protein L227DRAFT_33403 [Lentinus tigrinus ALCF2SS1-6]|uniref:Uncharacterized protein n=1 Tax=Lentinus tigrinus ALCF2SS1-6 TaxID=1328759 RepID=A0A5C2SGG2_9APHY|nr:hypothetical protein L227DRAFT_33403 [Lentinus tigrinus ALCF2SS1-6]